MKKTFLYLAVFLVTACGDTSDPKILFEQGKYEKAYELWQPLAINGDLTAQNYLGIHYYLGLGVRRNYKQAETWFEKAANGGLPDAQYNLGVMYENGEFVSQDYVTAYMWFFVANQNGNSNARKRMQGLSDEHKLFPNQIRRAQEMAGKLF